MMVGRGPCGSVLDAIGDTPLVNIEGVWAKLEYLNPSGSAKARVARYLVERAEAEGLLRRGDTIVEASSGNTGNAFAMVAAVKGYDVEENRTWLGPEILRALPATPDALVMGVGTGGTLIGVGQAFRAVNPGVRLVAVEPDESCTLACGEVERHEIEGIADGFVPGIVSCHRALIDEVVAVPGGESIAAMRHLARGHGLFVGPSSGAHFVAAQRLRRRSGLETVVTVFCDEGEKYLSDHHASHVTEPVALARP